MADQTGLLVGVIIAVLIICGLTWLGAKMSGGGRRRNSTDRY